MRPISCQAFYFITQINILDNFLNRIKHYSPAAKLNFGGPPCTGGPTRFIAVLISPDHTFHKTNGCQAGTLELFEKIQDGRQNGCQKDKK